MNFKIRILKGKQKLSGQKNGKKNDIYTHFSRKNLKKFMNPICSLNLKNQKGLKIEKFISEKKCYFITEFFFYNNFDRVY